MDKNRKVFALTIEQLAYMCSEQIRKGNGNKFILISNDDEGNGYHDLFFGFSENTKELTDGCFIPYDLNDEDLKNYVVLG